MTKQRTITLPVTKPYVHQGAPKAAVLCFGPPLADSCVRASVAPRPAPGNFQSYRASPLVLGGVFRAEVDVTTSGDTSAFVVASFGPTIVTLPTGQSVLSGWANAEFLPVRTGPIASWEFPIPNDWRLAGIQLTTQAVHLGGTPSANFSNVIDLTFGR